MRQARGIAIVLFENSDADQTQLEESLITHSHAELTKRLQSHVDPTSQRRTMTF